MSYSIIKELESKGDDCFLNSDLDAALKNYSEAIAMDQNNVAISLKCARVCFELEKLDDCIKYSDQIIKVEPSNSKAFIYKSKCLYKLDRKAEARVCLLKIPTKELTEDLKKMLTDCDESVKYMREYNLKNEFVAPKPRKTTQLSCKFHETDHQIELEFTCNTPNWKDVEVGIRPEFLSITIEFEHKSFESRFELKGMVNDKESTHSVADEKILVTLKKKNPGIWGEWQKNPITVKDIMEGKSMDQDSASCLRTTCKSDIWKSLGRNAEDEYEKSLDGDAACMNAFQHIYSNCDEKQRLAMSKSYCESSGTVLSMDFNKVMKKPTKVQPPEDMTFVKY